MLQVGALNQEILDEISPEEMGRDMEVATEFDYQRKDRTRKIRKLPQIQNHEKIYRRFPFVCMVVHHLPS